MVAPVAIRHAVVVACLFMLVACAARTPRSHLETAYRAVIIVGEIQSAAIRMNGIEACEAGTCQPLLSDANTATVIDVASVALRGLRETPEGWPAVLGVALKEWQARLDADGQVQLGGYLQAAQILIEVSP